MRDATMLLALTVLALSACGDAAPTLPGPVPNVIGTWNGPLGASATVSLTLSQTSAGDVTGDGTLDRAVDPDLDLEILSGTHIFPNLSLLLRSSAGNDFTYLATTTESTMTGTLQGGGFVGESLVLVRQ